MGRRLAALALAAFLLAPACSGDDPPGARPGAETAVVQAFEDYRAALLERSGDDAAALASASTLDYYEEMKELALEAPRSELKRRRITDQMTVLMLRHLLSAEELGEMDGRDVFAFSVDEGLTSENSVERLDPGDADVAGDRAVLGVRIEGERAPFTFVFVREQGRWKIDLGELLKVADSAIQTFVNQSGRSETAYLLQLLTSLSGTEPDRSIWEPLRT